jgi:hypothetical protein
MAHHDGDVMAGDTESQLNRVQDHRLPRDRMQHLGLLGMHPFSQAGSHDDSRQTWNGTVGRLSRLLMSGGVPTR